MSRTQPSSNTAHRVYADALRLNVAERTELVNRLLGSVDIDPTVFAAWEDEAARRMKEIDEGRVKAIPLSTALKRAFQRKRKKA